MADIEKVLKGLECCSHSMADPVCCKNCPYWHETIADEYDVSCNDYLCRDALELLKSYQPRVVTIDEIHNRDIDCVWIEYDQNHYRTFVIEPGIFCATTTGGTTMFSCGCGAMNFHDDEYNRAWRAWTARPSVEQRKTIPWED